MKYTKRMLPKRGKKSRNYYIKLFDFFEGNRITRRLADSISYRYELLYGSSQNEIKEKAAKLTLILLGSYTLMFTLIFGLRPSLFSFYTAIFVSYVVHVELLAVAARNTETKILSQIIRFISSVRHHFFTNHNIVHAVWESFDSVGKELRPQILSLYHCLAEEDMEQSVTKYQEGTAHKYLKMFLSLAANITEHGDSLVDGVSVFTTNLIWMKEDIHRDLREMKRSVFLFSGASFLLVLPLLTMPFIKGWAHATFPEVEEVYRSVYGVLMETAVFLLTILLYQFLGDLKERNNFHYSKHILLSKLTSINVIHQLLDNYIERNYRKIVRQKEILKRIGENHTVETLLLWRVLLGCGMAVVMLLIFLIAPHKDNYGIREPMAVLFALLLGYWYPYLVIWYRQRIILNRMQEEVLQFQSIIHMQMNLEGMDGRTILSSMEQFAVIFKPTLRICLNGYGNDDTEALLQMKASEQYPPFQHIADCFLMIQDIGMKGAFAELSSEIRNFREDRKVEREIMLERRTQAAMIISLLPFVVVLLAYLMGPLVYISLKMLNQTFQDMNAL